MDASASAVIKALDISKSAPAWLLAGLDICLLAIWLWPPFLASLPESARSAVPMAIAVCAILTCCKLVSSGLSQL